MSGGADTLREVLRRLPEQAIPHRLAAVHGEVRFEAPGAAGSPSSEACTVRFDRGEMTILDSPGAGPDVVLRSSVAGFAAIGAGEANAGLEYLRGCLDIEGDAELALAVGGVFRVPGTADVAVDPRALDPVDVATVLGEVDRTHLAKVMRSGFRGVVLGEIFGRLPEFVNPRKAAKVELRVGFRLTGHPSGEVERYVVCVERGAASVSAAGPADQSGEQAARRRDATVTCEGHDFLRLATGHLNPVLGVLRGQLKVRGDQARALQLSSVIDIPRSR